LLLVVNPNCPDLPYYGSWGVTCIYAGAGARQIMRADDIQPVRLPDPKDVRIAELEARIEVLEGRAARNPRQEETARC
jgi:hypothetical protein